MKHREIAVAMLFVVVLAGSAGAEVINGQNWADSVNGYTDDIQNYGGTPMDTNTEWWVTGVSDADVDGNGYALDLGDNDYVAGWRSGAPGEYIIVEFDTALTNIVGDDLVIRMYCGSSASADVLVSTNGTDANDFTSIGTIVGAQGQVPGKSGYLYDAQFDFAGQFAGDVHYVKVLRVGNGPQTGMFFDSFASAPEPATMVLLICGGAGLFLRRHAQKPTSPKDESVGK